MLTASRPSRAADPVAEPDVVLRQVRLAHRHERIDVAEVDQVAERLAGLELAQAGQVDQLAARRGRPLTSAKTRRSDWPTDANSPPDSIGARSVRTGACFPGA